MENIKNTAKLLKEQISELIRLGFTKNDFFKIIDGMEFPEKKSISKAYTSNIKFNPEDSLQNISLISDELNDDYILFFSEDLKIVFQSEKFSEIYEISKDSFLGLNFSDIFLDSFSNDFVNDYIENNEFDGKLFNNAIFRINSLLESVSFVFRKLTISQQNLFELKFENFEVNKQLNEIYNYLKSMINATTETAILTDNKGIILETNDTFASRAEININDLLGNDIFNMFDKSTAERRKKYFDEVIQTGQIVNYQDSRQGKLYDISQYPIKNNDNKVFRVAIFAKDITAEQNAIQKLKESEEKFRQFAELLPQTVFETDGSQQIVFSNRNGLNFFGYSYSDLESGLNVYDLMHPLERDIIREYVDKYIMKSGSFNFHCNAITKQGKIVPVSVFANAIYKNGEYAGVRGIVIDDSKYTNMEKAFLDSENRLKSLKNANNKLFSILAHDLRGPFTGFMNLTDTVAHQIEEIKVQDLKNIANDLHISAINLYRLLDNLLSWAMSQSGKIEAKFENFDISFILNEIVDYFDLNIKQKEITIIRNLKDNLIVYADKNMIKTAMRNIISNAIKFTNVQGTIEINTFYKDNCNIIKISDNGVGIPPLKLQYLFEINTHEFTKGTNNESGMGLGMVITKEFIESNNGKIRVESIENEGTVFTIMLPK